jgi:hypothetical protein
MPLFTDPTNTEAAGRDPDGFNSFLADQRTEDRSMRSRFLHRPLDRIKGLAALIFGAPAPCTGRPLIGRRMREAMAGR